MRTLVITEHPEFGKVRTVEAGGRVWFCARDVASALGYANPKDAVNRHCRPKGVCVHDLLTAGGRQKVKFIDEGNLYRLMACSRLPSAERFESWIFDELVPRTLKEGGYLLVDKDGFLTLTPSGLLVASMIYERHTLLTDFLVRLGVDPKVAAEDACKMEHDISEESFDALKRHVQSVIGN